jgi:copper homeostasis protein
MLLEICASNYKSAINAQTAGAHRIELCTELAVGVERTRQLIELSKPLSFTFHRAFDWTPNPLEALEQLIMLGAKRVLTSGQEPSAEKGIELLKQIQNKADGRITILPGGGINIENSKMFKGIGFTELHASATSINLVNEPPKISINSTKFYDETIEVVSDIEKIKGILKSLTK